MGMYDEVSITCSKCNKSSLFQSKSGPCTLQIFSLSNAPVTILDDLREESQLGNLHCEHCNEPIELQNDICHTRTLTDKDHINMDPFLGHVLDDYKDGVISKEQAISGLAHGMSALDNGEESEVRTWLEQGRKLIRE